MSKINRGIFLKHEACPACGSKDNLGRYTDGHAWCFGCGYFEAGTRTESPLVTVAKAPVQDIFKVCTLPWDASSQLDSVALNWLSKYEITSEEVREQRLKWSASAKQLIFPIYEGDTIVAYAARCFHNLASSKWRTNGFAQNEILNILGLTHGTEHGILIVEDIVSAIKCSRYMPVLCIYGTNLSTLTITRLKVLTDKLLLWLDPDATKKAISIAQTATSHGLHVKVLGTTKDPKEETDLEIKKQIGLLA